MHINTEIADLILRVVQWLVLPGLLWLVRSIMMLRRDIIELKARIDRLEEYRSTAPGETALHKLETAITAQGGDLKAIREAVSRLEQVVTRHEDYLLTGGGR